MINKLAKRGIHVETTAQDADIHVSGHPPQEDLKKLYKMIKPAIGIPVHGEIRNLIAHRDLFRSLGIRSELIDNGDVMELSQNYRCVAKVEIGQMGLDGKILIPRNGTVLLEREWLSAGGCVIVNISKNGSEITLFGVCEHSDHRFRRGLQDRADTILKTLTGDDRAKMVSLVRNNLQNHIFMERGIDPKIFVFIHSLPEVNKENSGR